MRGKRSDKLYLEPISELRRVEFLRLAKASREFHREWVAAPRTPAQFDKYMARIGKADWSCHFLCRVEDGALVGVVNISQIYRGFLQSAYLGYYVFSPFARQGYMSEGLAMAVGHAFTRLKLHRVEANVRPSNTPSKRLIRKLGFRREGYSQRYLKVGGKWEDHERWAMTREEWSGGKAKK